MGSNVFSNDNGIIHEQAQTDEKPHHGEHVKGKIDLLHEEKSHCKGDRKSHCDPEGKFKGKETEHGQKNKKQPLKAVDHKHIKPVPHHLGDVLGDLKRDTWGGLNPFIFNKLLYSVQNPQ